VRLGLVLVTCAAGAAVLALLALPLVGGAGLVAKAAADTFEHNDPVLLVPPLAQRTVLYDKTGKEFTELHGAEDRVVVALADVPMLMQQAIIGIEDSRFYEHHGVDFQGVLRAAVRNGQGGSTTQGGSTLTQQYVKNVLKLSAHSEAERQAATAQTFDRKLREARYALQLERELPKAKILENYLNIAYFGDGVYGVGTAAQHYFGVRVHDINLAQAAMLAGLVNSPSSYNPFLHPVAAKTRRDLVLKRMLDLRYITAAQQQRAAGVPVPTKASRTRPADACEGTEAPFFCDYVRYTLRKDPKLGDDQATRDREVYDGGLRVRTTLDPQVQAAAQAAVMNVIPATDRALAVLAVVEPGTGKVLAIAANRTYSSSKKPGTTKFGIGYTPLGFLPGSTFKMFTLVTALQQQLPVSTSFYAPGCYTSKIYVTHNVGPCQGFSNAGDETEAGTFDLASGTWFSVNTFFIQLEEKVGLDAVQQTAIDMGIPASRLEGVGGALTLGGLPRGVTPIDLATAYATLAAHGVECDPHPLSTVTDPQGKPVEVSHVPDCHRVVDTAVADTATGILEGVLTQRGATAQGRGLDGRVSAGKTGTTDNEASAWFAGFTPQLATAVGLGDPVAPSSPLGMVQGIEPVFGGTLPATIWQQAMNAALMGKPVADMPPAVATSVSGFGPQAPYVPYRPGPVGPGRGRGALPTGVPSLGPVLPTAGAPLGGRPGGPPPRGGGTRPSPPPGRVGGPPSRATPGRGAPASP
jgi:membrane peptidoglycan carboxypeptidase